MLIHHPIVLDLLNPGDPVRIPVKQGDTLTHSLQILLTAGAEPWSMPAEASPVLRWSAFDPVSGKSARGIYDTLPGDVHAWNLAENRLDFILAPQMLALPGQVRGDIAFVQREQVLATFNFELAVLPPPTDGTEPEAQDYYKVATLEQINAAMAEYDRLLANLEHEVESLKQIVNEL